MVTSKSSPIGVIPAGFPQASSEQLAFSSKNDLPLLTLEQDRPVFVLPLSFIFCFFVHNFIYILTYWLWWVFIAACRLSPGAASGSYSLVAILELSLWWPLLLESMGSRALRLQELQFLGSKAQAQ